MIPKSSTVETTAIVVIAAATEYNVRGDDL